MSKILVTGGAGFIGSHIVDKYIEKGHKVIIVDDMSTGKEENINKKASKFYWTDIRDPRQVLLIFEQEKPDIVNHHAAQTSVNHSVCDTIGDANTNILGSIAVIKSAIANGVKKFIYASSGGAVYGDPNSLPVNEDAPVKPLSPYGCSKYIVEHYLRSLAGEMGYVTLRYANVFGPRQDPHGEAGVIAVFSNLLLEGKAPTIFGDGEAVRDYVYISDVVDINMIVTEQDTSRKVYNVGSGIGNSVNELLKRLKLVIKELKPEVEFQDEIHTEEREGDVKKTYLAANAAKADLGWKCKVCLTKGLKLTVQSLMGGN